MALQDVHHPQTKGAVDGQCRTTHAEAQAVPGRGPGAAARGLPGAGAEREGGADPELDSVGLDARPDAAGGGGRGAGGCALCARGRCDRGIPGAIGLSSSSVSRAFIAASAAKLKEFQERDLSGACYVALFLDGKSFADATLVIALGVTSDGTKRFLGFVETDTENDKV